MNIHTQIFDEIANALEVLDMTRADLAVKMQIAPEKLDAMFDNIEEWDVSTFAKICTVLEMTPSFRFVADTDSWTSQHQYTITIPTKCITNPNKEKVA